MAECDANPILSSRKTNWSLCCLCQKDKRGEHLTSPPSHHVLDHDGYTMLARNIPMFSEINEMPLIMDPARLDEGDGIEATLRKNAAKYHVNCRLLFNNTKLDRARKRQSCASSPAPVCRDGWAWGWHQVTVTIWSITVRPGHCTAHAVQLLLPIQRGSNNS